MNLNLTKENETYKKIFKLQEPQRDGLILSIHHTDKASHKIRFINTCFDSNGQLLVLADNDGNIFVIDFVANKFWNIPKVVGSVTVIKFSNLKTNEVLLGTFKGTIYVIDAQTGLVSSALIGHKLPISSISLSHDSLCLSSSLHEAIIWDLKTCTKLQILNLNHGTDLKFVVFIPITNNILACFDDDIVQIWNHENLEMRAQLEPTIWFNHPVKSIAFTKDGRTMLLACRSPHLAIFLLNNFKLLKFITLPEYIQNIKHVEFLPHSNDGGSHKTLVILSSRGTIYFCDTEHNVIISELSANLEISKFDCSARGNLLACVISSGRVNIYDICEYTAVTKEIRVSGTKIDKAARSRESMTKLGDVRSKIRDILDHDKLRMILDQFGEYPDEYRSKIWEQLLELPNQRDTYNAIMNHRIISSFEDLYEKYPLENKRNLKNLRQLLDNLVTWCPFFYQVEFLPVFVFPFVKLFHNKPITCFEAVITIIFNWCQFWFEYFPLPPINILSMIENLILEHDPVLLNHLAKYKISSRIYAWPILKTAFSEAFTASNWKVFWDHVLTNHPAFLLCGVTSYNILQRTALLNLNDEKQFVSFYYTDHYIDFKKFLAKSYHILNKTSEKFDPKQYLRPFKKLNPEEYPQFNEYPRTTVNLRMKKELSFNEQLKEIELAQADLLKKRILNYEDWENYEIQQEEEKRILEMERVVKEGILNTQQKVKDHFEKLSQLRHKYVEENKNLDKIKERIFGSTNKNREKILTALVDDLRLDQTERDYFMKKEEEDLLFNFAELLRRKCKIEELLNIEQSSTSVSSAFDRQQEKLSAELSQMRGEDSDTAVQRLKNLNLTTGIATMDALIHKVENEIYNEGRGLVDESTANRRVRILQAETKDLMVEINKLLNLLVELRGWNADYSA